MYDMITHYETPHILPSRASYEISIASILEKKILVLYM